MDLDDPASPQPAITRVPPVDPAKRAQLHEWSSRLVESRDEQRRAAGRAIRFLLHALEARETLLDAMAVELEALTAQLDSDATKPHPPPAAAVDATRSTWGDRVRAILRSR